MSAKFTQWLLAAFVTFLFFAANNFQPIGSWSLEATVWYGFMILSIILVPAIINYLNGPSK